MFNRKKLAVPSVLLAAFVFCSSAGVPAYAGDVSGSEAVSVETTKEAPTEASVETTKKAEEPPAPVKEAPADPVVPVVPDPVAPPVEQPAPAPVVPDPVVVPVPAVPAAPVAPQVETPVAPELPAVPAKDVVIDDPAPVVVVPPVQAAAPVGDPVLAEVATSTVKASAVITTEPEINAQGWIILSAEVQPAAAGVDLGKYTLNLEGAQARIGMNEASLLSGEDGTDYTTLWWECATPGATISITGPNGLIPIFNEITGTTATSQVLPILGTPGCGTTTPTKTVVPVTPGEPKFIPAGPGKHGSIEYPGTVGVVYTADPAGATEGLVKVTATAAPETADTIYVLAPGAQTVWSGDLGEFSEEVPNPGTPHEYASGDVKFAGKVSPATLVPFAGPFIGDEYAYPEVKGTAHDGSPVTVSGKLQYVIGGVTINDILDLSPLCGKATWTWYAKADTKSTSPKWIINAGFIGDLPACDPQGGDDGGDNENPNPNPNPNPDPSHPGHGHDHDGDHDHDCDWWNGGNCNGHAGGPGFNGPTTTPGDLVNNDVADLSVSPFVVQQFGAVVQGQGSALPFEWSSDNSSDTESTLPYTGAHDAYLPAAMLLLGVGLLVLGLLKWSSKKRQVVQ